LISQSRGLGDVYKRQNVNGGTRKNLPSVTSTFF
jgi:hypothetical protein